MAPVLQYLFYHPNLPWPPMHQYILLDLYHLCLSLNQYHPYDLLVLVAWLDCQHLPQLYLFSYDFQKIYPLQLICLNKILFNEFLIISIISMEKYFYGVMMCLSPTVLIHVMQTIVPT